MQVTLDCMPRRAKPKTDDSAPKGTETVRIDKDLAKMLTVVSIQEGVSVSELLSPLVRDAITTRYRAVVKRMHDAIETD